MNGQTSFQVLIECCRELLTQQDDFWILASLSDLSYEEGVRAPDYRRYLGLICDDSFGPTLRTTLERGINGNLAEAIRGHPSVSASSVRQSPSRGADVTFELVGGPRTELEVKMIYDCTFTKYYACVAEDAHKLDKRSDRLADAYLVVFFTQLPCYDYPAGLWYGVKPCQPRSFYCVRNGVQSQFQLLLSKLRSQPSWPQDGPELHCLGVPTQALTEARIQGVFERIFKPNGSWSFDPVVHLRDAKVGVAVWKR